MTQEIKPIKPSEVLDRQIESIPASVIETFNTLIIREYRNGSATIKQKEVVKILIEKGLVLKEIYDNGWLDIEDLFRKEGWSVEYDKPGYNESYDAFFVFRQKR